MSVKIAAMRVADAGPRYDHGNSRRELCAVCRFDCWVSSAARDVAGPDAVILCLHCAVDGGSVVARAALASFASPSGGRS